MSAAVFLLKIILVILTVKASLFWLYIWQLKEYRLLRFMAEYGGLKKILRLWLFSGGRRFYAPVWTSKAILALMFLFALLLLSAVFLPYLLVYFLAAPLATAVVYILRVPTNFMKESVYRRAESRIRRAKEKGLIVVGITGSYGKSSTKEFLSQILSHKFKVLKTPRNINSELGVARFVLDKVSENDKVLVVEMGAYHTGEIANLARIARPEIGILTGITEQHLALFGSLENIKKAKFELIESLPQNGLAVFNGDNEYLPEMAKRWQGKSIIYHRDQNLRPDLPPHYQTNLSGAVEVARYLGMSDKEIEAGIKNIRLTDIMISTHTGRGGAFVINDTYSANPEGVRAALIYLKQQPQKRKIIVMPCLIELGPRNDEIHTELGKLINEACDVAIITTADSFAVLKGALGEKAFLATRPDMAINFLQKAAGPDAAILLEGRIPESVVTFLQ